MLRISRRAEYAVRTMVAVARAPSGAFISTPEIGKRMLIPQPFLVKVIGDLKRGGLVTTAVGRRGGVTLARPPEQITLRHIIEAVDGPPAAVTECLVDPGACSEREVCLAHDAWVRVRQSLQEQMDAISLRTLSA